VEPLALTLTGYLARLSLQGTLANGLTVAVKRLSLCYKHEKEFQREVECLLKVKHTNIVRFLGYCADTQGTVDNFNGKVVMADIQEKLLCFEYLPKGSLDKYITGTKYLVAPNIFCLCFYLIMKIMI
jgi:serine/threonine protein kinase